MDAVTVKIPQFANFIVFHSINGHSHDESKAFPVKAEELAEQMKDFAQFHDHEKLSLVLSEATDLLHELKLRSPKSQTTITGLGNY